MSTNQSTKEPEILGVREIARSRLFKVEGVSLRFSNGAEVEFERICASGSSAAFVMALNDRDELLLISEYAAGVERYELSFVKGKVDDGESAAQAANRELQEEIGFAAADIRLVRSFRPNPGYGDTTNHLFIARDLSESRLQGDEVEPLQIVPWPLARLHELLDHPQVTDPRTLFGIYYLLNEVCR